MGKILKESRFVLNKRLAMQNYQKASELLVKSFDQIKSTKIHFKLKKDRALRKRIYRLYSDLDLYLFRMKKRIGLD